MVNDMTSEDVTSSSDLPDEGAVLIVSDVPLTEEEQQALIAEAERLESEKQAALDALAGKIEKDFITRSGRRRAKENEWLRASRLYLGSKSANKGNNLETEGGSGRTRPDHNLVKEKCSLAIAQLYSGQFAGGDQNWRIAPSPRPDIDPAEAAQKARNMERLINDQLEDTRYGIECRKAIEDRVVYGTGIVKGPVPSLKPKLTYDVVQQDGLTLIPRHEFLPKPVVERINPWFFFPDDTVAEFIECEDAIEVHPMSKSELAKLAMNPGFNKEVIEELCKAPPAEYNQQAFQEANSLTESGENYLRNKYVVLERHGPISIDEMAPLGLSPTFDSIGNTYYGEVWVCNGRVIRASLEAVNGCYELPYALSTWNKDPNSVFGFGLPMDAEDAQRIHTATLHMVLDNASISSGPMVILNKEYIEPANGSWELAPHKVFFTTDTTLQNVDQAFKSVVIPNVGGGLTPMMDRAEAWAQSETGINMFAGGSAQVGPDSATGLSIVQQQATVVTDMLNEQWDDEVTSKIIRRMFHWNLQYNPSPDIIGDFEVDVRSSTEIRSNQIATNNLEKLSVEAAQNPMLADMLDMAQLTRTRLSNLKIPNVGIVKTEEQIQQEQEAKAQQPPPPDPNMIKLEIERNRVKMERERLAFEREKFQFETTKQAKQVEFEEFVNMQQVQARREDAQSRILQAQTEREIEMLRLAQRSEEHREKIMAQLQLSNMTAETAKFLKGIDINNAAQDRLIKEREMMLKQQTGSGI